MKKNLTELVFILDKSGSMSGMEEDTIGGFNAMIEKQKKLEGEAYVSTVLFSNKSVVLHDRVELNKIETMTKEQYQVDGCTALYDAIGDAIHHICNVHKYVREEDRPEKTMFIITTDGMENASRSYTRSQIKKKISKQEDKYGWEFLFVGANIDACEVAEEIGIKRESSANYKQSKKGTRAMYDAVCLAVSSVRTCKEIGVDWKEKLDK